MSWENWGCSALRGEFEPPGQIEAVCTHGKGVELDDCSFQPKQFYGSVILWFSVLPFPIYLCIICFWKPPPIKDWNEYLRQTLPEGWSKILERTAIKQPWLGSHSLRALANSFATCQSVSRLKLVSEEQQVKRGHMALLPCSASYKHKVSYFRTFNRILRHCCWHT